MKIIRNKKKKHNKIVTLVRSKLNSIEALISQTLISSEISRDDFLTITNKGENYRSLKEDIRMIKSQGSDTEKKKLIEEGKRIGINKIFRQNKGNA